MAKEGIIKQADNNRKVQISRLSYKMYFRRQALKAFYIRMFKRSFGQHKNMFSEIPENLIYSCLNKSIDNILPIHPKVISVGISEDECVYIYFEKNEKSVFLNLLFEPDQETEASVTIFENNKTKISYTGYLADSLDKIRNEF